MIQQPLNTEAFESLTYPTEVHILQEYSHADQVDVLTVKALYLTTHPGETNVSVVIEDPRNNDLETPIPLSKAFISHEKASAAANAIFKSNACYEPKERATELVSKCIERLFQSKESVEDAQHICSTAVAAFLKTISDNCESQKG